MYVPSTAATTGFYTEEKNRPRIDTLPAKPVVKTNARVPIKPSVANSPKNYIYIIYI